MAITKRPGLLVRLLAKLVRPVVFEAIYDPELEAIKAKILGLKDYWRGRPVPKGWGTTRP